MKTKIQNSFVVLALMLVTNFASATYLPDEGRWIQRDPIGENGGLNIYGYVGNNPINYVDPLGLEVNLYTHTVFPPFQHSNLRLYPDYPENFPQNLLQTDPNDGRAYIALGAGPQDGDLVSDPNRPKDLANRPNHYKYTIPSPPCESNDDFINNLLDADAAYQDNLNYHLFPGIRGGYNSNSYIDGLLHATTRNYYPKPSPFTPGWNTPVPDQQFQY